MVREFYIENDLGQRFSMMDIENGCFLSSPTGLGYSYDIDYAQIGNNFIPNIRKITQGQIGGELIFKNYDNYKKFINFVESGNELKFVYKVPYDNNSTEFFKDIDVSIVDKTEIGVNGVLIVPATFNAKSLWYEAREIVYTINDSVSDDELRWDFSWDAVFTSYNSRNMDFENKGHEEAPFKLELDGEIVNPSIAIIEDGEETKKLDLDGLTIQEGEKLVYNTKDTEQEIYKKTTSNTKVNLFNFLNPNFINFFKLRKGLSTIRLESDGEITSGKLTIYVQYKAV